MQSQLWARKQAWACNLGSGELGPFYSFLGTGQPQGTAFNFIKCVLTSLLPPNGNSLRKQDPVRQEARSKALLRTGREEFPAGGEAGRGFFLQLPKGLEGGIRLQVLRRFFFLLGWVKMFLPLNAKSQGLGNRIPHPPPTVAGMPQFAGKFICGRKAPGFF